MRTDPLVSTAWLAERLGQVKVLDATFFLPGQGDARAAYVEAHLPGARFFDVDAVADQTSGLPHMLPTPEAFAQAMGSLGVGDEDHVVAYGMAGPRLWWSLRVMGHDKVSVLDGGLAKWKAEDRPLEAGEPASPTPARFTPRFRPELVADLEQVRRTLAQGGQVADARSGERFRGEAPEPRPGLPSGHMPGAASLPSALLFAADGSFKSNDDIAALLKGLGLDRSQPLTATCGSGVTAAMIALALARLGHWETPVYDGSWSEWAARDDTAIATGAA